MRQAGMLAGAGLYALENHVERLSQDHANAKKLASALSDIDGFSCNSPETNIVFLSVDERKIKMERFVKLMKEVGGIDLAGSYSSKMIRLVTHLDINEEDIHRVIQEATKLAQSGALAV